MKDSQKLVAGALLAGGSLLTGSTALITVAGGIGVNWTSEALAGLWDSRALAAGQEDVLAKAYQRAIRQAVGELRRQYTAAAKTSAPLQAFDLVAACAGSIGDAQFPSTLEVADVQRALDDNLASLLYGHDEREVGFLKRNLLPAVARSFRNELAADDEAWRRYHGWLIEQMAAEAARAAAAAAASAAVVPPAPPEMDRVLAAFEDAAAAQARLDAGADRLEELIRQWEEAAAMPPGGAAVTFHNEGMQATNVVQGQEAYSQSAIAKEGGTATVFNISGAALTPELLAALLGAQAPGQPTIPKNTQAPVEPLPLAGLPVRLTGKQFGALQAALLAAFTLDSLRQLVLVGLDEHLDHIVGGSTLSAVVFNLIDWAQRTGRLPALLQAAHAAAPLSPELHAFLGQFGV